MSAAARPFLRLLGSSLLLLLVVGGGGLYAYYLWGLSHSGAGDTKPAPPPAAEEVAEASPEQVKALCASCHAYPPPDSFPRSAWRYEVLQGFQFAAEKPVMPDPPSPQAVIKYYENRAPESLPWEPEPSAPGPPPVKFARTVIHPPGDEKYPIITYLNLAPLTNAKRPDLLACDMHGNSVLALNPADPSPSWRTLAHVPYPDHVEVVDLDGDGIKDLLVACLGMFGPSDDKGGKVVWLRGKPDGTFTPITLLEGVGRVADVQAADFRGTGRLDLVVAAFGWRHTGEIILLENQTTDWDHPKFVPRVLDERHGAIHVPVTDLNGDGKPDFVALISQEHETVVAFLNDGKGGFQKKTIYTAPHPAWGSSGIQLVDLNGDGKLDVLYTNGDILDPPFLLKPYHSVQWLENPGDGTFPWKYHHLASMPGVMRALAADLTGKGLPDVVAVSYLPALDFPDREPLHMDAVILLEQTAPGRFVRHSLEQVTCDHLALAVGDWDGSGRPGLVVGNGDIVNKTQAMDALTLWKNLGPPGAVGR